MMLASALSIFPCRDSRSSSCSPFFSSVSFISLSQKAFSAPSLRASSSNFPIIPSINFLTLANTSFPAPWAATAEALEASSDSCMLFCCRPRRRRFSTTDTSPVVSSLSSSTILVVALTCNRKDPRASAPPVFSSITCFALAKAFSSSFLSATLASWSEAVCMQSDCKVRRDWASAAWSFLETSSSPVAVALASRCADSSFLLSASSDCCCFPRCSREDFTISKLYLASVSAF
mmetsp:Transcript_35184/g.92155  ORF Transcript_35184/g.92155 Transcript_35184/m.92155 type:complete len:233 (-) Transcript_35184:747-1445(-)